MTSPIDICDRTFLTIAKSVMDKHGCTMGDGFDYEKRILDITGPSSKAMTNCALELADKLSSYLVE